MLPGNKKTREVPGLILRRFDVLFCSDHTFFADPCALSTTLALVEQFGAANITRFIDYNGINIRGGVGENPFNTHTIRDLANCEGSGEACALALDHIPFKRLDPFFITLNDLVIDSNIVSWLESGELFFATQLLVYVFYSAHD